MEIPFLKIKDVSKTYSTGSHIVHALKDVNIEIKKGEIFGLLGPNGAGKTTLSSIIATLHPPTSGDILFKGKSIYKELMSYRHHLGFCPQKQNLDPFLTVEQNLIFSGRYYLMPEEKIQKRVPFLLKQFELEKYAQFSIDELSGGTQQRVLIARALVHEPEIVILDEPTVGLDPDIRKKLWQEIKNLKNMGITVILTTHYLDEAEVLSDRICILDGGTVKLIESVQHLKEKYQMRLEDIFIQLIQE